MDSGEFAPTRPNETAGFLGAAKYDRSIPDYDPDLRKAAAWTYHRLAPYVGNSKILSWSEAIFGSEQYTGINMSKSPGAILSNIHKTHADVIDSPSYTEDLARFYKNYASSVESFIQSVWTSSIKDEKRAVEKLLENNMRNFCGCPHFTTVIVRKLTIDQNQRMMDNHERIPSKIGVTKFNGVWNRLIHQLLRFEKGFAFDIGRYDSSIFPKLFDYVCDMRCKWICEEDRKKYPEFLNILRNFYGEVNWTLICSLSGELYRKWIGNNSGQPNTAFDNTIILLMLFCGAYIKLFPNKTYADWLREIEQFLFGDDNTMSVSPSIIDVYTADNIIKVFRECWNINVTVDVSIPRPVTQLDFLSCKWSDARFKGFFLPLMNKEKLKATLKFVKGRPTYLKTIERIGATLVNAYPDPEFYEQVKLYYYWIRSKYGHLFTGPDYQNLYSQIPTDYQLEQLYTAST